jgi:hypothetical protein
MQNLGYLFLGIITNVFLVSPGICQQQTWCNPLNIDYTYMIYNAHQDKSYRSGADPAVVEFRGEYYMFVTRSMGYWHSTDLMQWQFIQPEKWYFQGSNAPAAFNYNDSVLYVAGDPSGSMSVLYTDNPKKGDWKATPGILNNLQDPALFIDDDESAYIYWGSSNRWPIRAKRLDKNKRFRPSETTDTLFGLDMARHGWERFGHNHMDTILGGYMEGPWMTKHNGKYYLEYAAPGTEFNVYGDGAYTADHPLGPYKYMPNNPFSYKPGGYMNGAGHGSTVIGPGGQYWHFASMAVSVNVNWERRLCMFPTYFDKDALMYSDCDYGDYPRLSPLHPEKPGQFAGWMLLSYKKPVTASTNVDAFVPGHVTDESVKTFWLAEKNDSLQWLMIDLEAPAMVHAIQVNYHDYESDMYGRLSNLYHRYMIEGSLDGKTWMPLIDKRNSFKDTPNDYTELGTAQTVRYIRYRNGEVPTPHLAISGLRIFGKGAGKPPTAVAKFSVQRQSDKRDALITWQKQPAAQGYNIRWGIAPDKLYNSWMVYDDEKLLLKSLTIDQPYYFSIEAFNENGISARTNILSAL